MQQRRNREQISELVREYEKSGLSVDDFAQRKGVKIETVRSWFRITKKAPIGHQGPHKPDQRRQAVEAYFKSGLTQRDFAKTWKVSPATLNTWLKQYKAHGPKGLEASSFKENALRRGVKGISEKFKETIVQTKLENPGFGIRKVRDFLVRFRGVKVSTGTINKTLKNKNIKTELVPRKRKRRSEEPRRFERARPMQLWQSDITSFNLPRSGQKVYLTVFLDDNARYIVGWNLQLRQTQDLVIDALLSGIEGFGKPEEVLTDQGRQYFSWRGKSDFQKLLIKQGIKHVVARSHHPQTVGKCERLWETINVELLDRIRPQTLEEAKERLGHFFNHYNHFRPHQGIDGMTPADRFFGVENEIRKVLESSITKNELLLAIGDSPRSPVFLIGQIGDQKVSMHGESGKLIVQTPDGNVQELNYQDFGQTLIKGANHGHTGTENGSRDDRNDKDGSPAREEQKEFQNTSPSRASEGSMGECARGPEEKSTFNGSDSYGILDGQIEQNRSSEAIRGSATSNMATVPTGIVRDDGRTARPAEDEKNRSDYETGRRHESTAEENSGAREDGRPSGTSDQNLARDARMQGCDDANGKRQDGIEETKENSGSTQAWETEKDDTDRSSK